MTRDKLIIIVLIWLIIIMSILLMVLWQPKPMITTTQISAFKDDFSKDQILEEAGDIEQSTDANWWLNSGGRLIASKGTGKTIQGALSSNDRWRKEYSASSAADTDNGAHPQNLFRLVQRNFWQNFTQEVYFKVNAAELSASSNRNESNGLLLFNRYIDGDNLYYAGLRVDGGMVIKKKYKGTYYTLALEPFTTSSVKDYNKTTRPNLIPTNTWIGIRTEIVTNPDKTVSIKVFIDPNRQGTWILALEALDDGKQYGGSAILDSGHAGIRTDFMDVEFDDYTITEL
jgi:hypothetical protein